MDADDGELLETQTVTPLAADPLGVIIDLRRCLYRCELLQNAEFSDGDRQALWESVVTTYYACFTGGGISPAHLQLIDPVHLTTHGLLERERARHTIGETTVIPDGLCPLDLEAGALSPAYVDPEATRALVEALLAQLDRQEPRPSLER